MAGREDEEQVGVHGVVVEPEHHGAEVAKHVRIYYMVFGALAALTLITVLAGTKLQLATGLAIGVALAIATVKASLVALFFMHLISEKRIIYWCLGLAGIFFLALMALPSFTDLEVRVF